jgi:hypothetical protein
MGSENSKGFLPAYLIRMGGGEDLTKSLSNDFDKERDPIQMPQPL